MGKIVNEILKGIKRRIYLICQNEFKSVEAVNSYPFKKIKLNIKGSLKQLIDNLITCRDN